MLQRLKSDEPGVEEAVKQLRPIRFRFHRAKSKYPTYSKKENPAINIDVFYMLPLGLLKKYIAALPLGNNNSDAISVFSQKKEASEAKQQKENVPTQRMTKQWISSRLMVSSLVLRYRRYFQASVVLLRPNGNATTQR